MSRVGGWLNPRVVFDGGESPGVEAVAVALAAPLQYPLNDLWWWSGNIESLRDAVFVNYQPKLVPKEVLSAARIAINLHTGPPEWPGRGSCSWALLNGDKTFGVTAHLMTEKYDDGRILCTREFAIDDAWDAEALHRRTLEEVPRLAKDLIDALKAVSWDAEKLAFACGKRWARAPKTLKQLREAMVLESGDLDLRWTMDRNSVERAVRAFAYTGKPGPGIRIGDRIFWYEKGKG